MPLKRGNTFVKRLYRKKGSVTNEVLELKDTKGNLIHRRSQYKFYLEDNTILGTYVYTWGVETVSPPSIPSKPNHDSLGWYTAKTGGSKLGTNEVADSSDKKYHVRYKIYSYEVTWKDWNGDILKTQMVDHGSNGVNPPNPTRSNYVFNGWSTNANNITGERTITATYLGNPFTLTIPSITGVIGIEVRDSGTGSLYSNGDTIRYSQILTISASADTGYKNPTISPSQVTVTGNINISDYVTRGAVLNYTLTKGGIPFGVESFIVNRTSSPLQKATTGSLSNGNAIYYGDILVTTSSASTGYNNPTLKRGTSTISSGTSTTVTGNLSFSVTSGTLISWNLSKGGIPSGVKSFLVERTSSPLGEGSITSLSNGSIIYYNDELKITATPEEAYNNPKITHNGSTINTGTVITATSRPIVSVAAGPMKSYVVTWLDWNDTVLKTETVFHGNSGTHPSSPTRTGYNFTGWNTNANNIIANRTITAQYSIKTYTVTWKDWDGTTLKTQTVSHGSNGTHPSNPSRQGYEFTDWSHAATNVTANRTITAQYERLRYYVKWMRDWNNTIIKDEYVYWGESAVAPSLQDMQFYEGYELDGMSADHTYITSDLTIYVTQKRKTYKLTIGSLTGVNTITVRLNTSGGTILSNNANITHGDKLYITATAASGYNAPTVSGSPVTVKGNVIASSYVTRGSVRSFKLTKNAAPTGVSGFTVTRTSSPLQGASTGTLNTNATIYYNDKLKATASATTGYNSPTIYPSSLTSTNGLSVTGNVTASVTAGSKITYRVRWYEGWGSQKLLDTFYVEHGATSPGPAAINYGAGYEGNGQSVSHTNITQDTDIYVYRKLINYTVSLYNFDESFIASKSFTVETATFNLTTVASNPTRNNYTFKGWYTALSGGSKVTQIVKGTTGNKTYYAQFNINQYTVTIGAKPAAGVNLWEVRRTNVNGALVTSGTKVDHGTVLYVRATAATGYTAPTIKKGSTTVSSGTTHTITAATSFSVTAGDLPETILGVNVMPVNIYWDDNMNATLSIVISHNGPSYITYTGFNFDAFAYSTMGYGGYTTPINLTSTSQIIEVNFPGNPEQFNFAEVYWPTQSKVINGVTYKINGDMREF